ncbi:MAG: DNRLRE domain-containing protein, partial [Dehalococcoidia bacterium]|nr:DNRLRE domain-containing protein [Dehalococcoidia bacterium]
ATGDAVIFSGFPISNTGTWSGMGVGYLAEGGYGTQRGLVSFDTASIPSSAVVTTATLWIEAYAYQGTVNLDMLVSTYRVTAPWLENSVTWQSHGSAFSVAYGSTMVGQYVGYVSFDVTQLVQSWVNGTIPNYGIILRGETESGTTRGKIFYTREAAVGDRPVLSVSYRY